MEEKKNIKILAAPIQGLTEPAWRHYHKVVYGDGIDNYYTPFLRVERGEIRHRDLRDLRSEFNRGVNIIPQIIFRDMWEFAMLCDAITDSGYRKIDINMGCPFPPQVHHGRGAGMIANRELLSEVGETIAKSYDDVEFSIKMRLGVESPQEWGQTIDVINGLPISRLTVHPRTARQQYKGELWMDEFEALLSESSKPVVYNGDILTPEQIGAIAMKYPSIEGIMIGRGLFSRPSLAVEWSEGKGWDSSKRLDRLMRLHNDIYSHYKETLSGDAQILGKMKPFWEYADSWLERKVMKGIKKATSLRKYEDALTGIAKTL